MTGQYAILAFLALDLHQRSGLSLPEGSALVAVANVFGVIGRLAWGALSDRSVGSGRKSLLLALNGVALVSTLLLWAVPASAEVLAVGVITALAGFTLVGFQGIWMPMIAEAAGARSVGAATGFAVTFLTLTIAISPPLFGLLADSTGSYRSIWGALSVLVALAFLPAVGLSNPKPAPG